MEPRRMHELGITQQVVEIRLDDVQLALLQVSDQPVVRVEANRAEAARGLQTGMLFSVTCAEDAPFIDGARVTEQQSTSLRMWPPQQRRGSLGSWGPGDFVGTKASAGCATPRPRSPTRAT